ncbi:hypothetical protein M23134_06875 [Microscilla marina ATCC 23134]|uniref:Uncharacterized protein n=1 Tax=Microscilla marina ATCC 23134 TaxID=313606 RepID=A1ZQ65_MICM2|nr:hypothetical protein M23134_06875 [Microscilla marina ATCC 23134]
MLKHTDLKHFLVNLFIGLKLFAFNFIYYPSTQLMLPSAPSLPSESCMLIN